MLSLNPNLNFGQYIHQGKADPYEYYKSFYVHIPKCGGSSINTTLAKQNGTIVRGHTSALGFRQQNPKKFENYYKFAHIRNPLDRLVSAFFFGLKGRLLEPFYVELVGGITDFVKYVEAVYSNFNILINCEAICPQIAFIADEDGKILVDDLFLFENITTSWNTICQRISCPDALIHKNSTVHRHYYEYYTPESIDMVYELYSTDFKIYENAVYDAVLDSVGGDLRHIND